MKYFKDICLKNKFILTKEDKNLRLVSFQDETKILKQNYIVFDHFYFFHFQKSTQTTFICFLEFLFFLDRVKMKKVKQ